MKKQTNSMIEKIADILTHHMNSNIIFADPVKKGDIIIIPVSRIRFGFGGGDIHKSNTPSQNATGGGAGGDIQPIGYIEIKKEDVRFKPIKLTFPPPLVFAFYLTTIWALIKLFK